MSTSKSPLSQDAVFDILSSPRRRYVLYYLRTTGEPVQLTDLAEQAAAWENDTEPEEITEQERKRVYVSLYQTHVPRLAEAGIIEYDKESGTITLSDDAQEIDQYLSPPEPTVPWQKIYLALAGVSAVLLGLTTVVGVIPETVSAVAVIIAFIITVVIHSAVQFSNRQSVPDELRE